MDGESRFHPLYRMLQHFGGRRRAYEQFSDATIAGFLLWRAIHNKRTGPVEDWLAMPMPVEEAKAVRQLVRRMPRGQYLIGDNLFDKNHLYDLVATRDIQLIAPPKCSQLRRLRNSIERRFGNLASHHLGLTHLPAWVRGIGRLGRRCALKRLSDTLTRADIKAMTRTMP